MKSGLSILASFGMMVVFVMSADREITDRQLDTIRGAGPCEAVGLRPQVCYQKPGSSPGSCDQEINFCDYGGPGQENTDMCAVDTTQRCNASTCQYRRGHKEDPAFCTSWRVPAL